MEMNKMSYIYKVVFSLLTFLVLTGIFNRTLAQVPQTEIDALIQLYEEFDGPNWRKQDNWKDINGDFDTTNVANWYGVTVENGHVTRLVFFNWELSGGYPNKLNGDISHWTKLGDLSYLTILELQSNNVYGDVAGFNIGGLNDLLVLNLFYTNLEGDIADLNVPNKPNIIRLEIASPYIYGNFSDLHLEEYNELKSLQISQMTSTGNTLDLHMDSLANLQTLKLISLPNLEGDIANLYINSLDNIYQILIDNVPGMYGNLKDLKLDSLNILSYFGLGRLPDVEGNIKDLNFSNMPHMKSIFLSEIPIVGNIIDLNLLSNPLMTNLYIGHTNLEGDIGDLELRHMNDLYALSFIDNNLTGDIGNLKIDSLTKLRSVYLSSNHISGDIKDFKANTLTSLAYLDIDNNEIYDSGSGLNTTKELNRIKANDNAFTFSSLLDMYNLIIDKTPYYFTYQNQEEVDKPRILLAMQGQSFTFHAGVDTATSPPSKFQWFKDGTPLTNVDAANKQFTIDNVTLDDYGDYYYTIINDSLPDLTLTSKFQSLAESICSEETINVLGIGSTCATVFNANIPNSVYTLSNYQWDFGDGSTSTEATPVHSYNSPGSYNVNVILNYSDGECLRKDTTSIVMQIVPDSAAYDDIELVIPTTQIQQILSASAVTYADAWPLNYQDSRLDTLNGYEKAQQGVWRKSTNYVYNTSRLASSAPNLAEDGTFTLNRFNWVDADLEAIPGWQKVATSTRYNGTGFEVESKDVLGNYSGALYGYYGQLPIAVANNARQQEMAYTGFEQDTTYSNWNFDTSEKVIEDTYEAIGKFNMAMVTGDVETLQNYDSVTVNFRGLNSYTTAITTGTKKVRVLCVNEGAINGKVLLTLGENIHSNIWTGEVIYNRAVQASSNAALQSSVVHTGNNALQVNDTARFEQALLKPEVGKSYVLEGWVSIGNSSLIEPVLGQNIGVTITYKDKYGSMTGSAVFVGPSGRIVEGWQQFHKTIILPEGVTSFDLTFHAGTALTVYFDDLRFFPADAVMQSYVYEPDTYRLRAQLDENNYATLYYYDKEGKLQLVKKETVDGIKTLKESVNYTVKR